MNIVADKLPPKIGDMKLDLKQKAQKYLLENSLDDEVLNKLRYRENTPENAKKWKYASDIMVEFAELLCGQFEQLVRQKNVEEIQGIEVNVDFYKDFIKRNIRCNEGTPNDEIRVYYPNRGMQIFKIK